jgi:hypothetical protein
LPPHTTSFGAEKGGHVFAHFIENTRRRAAPGYATSPLVKSGFRAGLKATRFRGGGPPDRAASRALCLTSQLGFPGFSGRFLGPSTSGACDPFQMCVRSQSNPSSGTPVLPNPARLWRADHRRIESLADGWIGVSPSTPAIRPLHHTASRSNLCLSSPASACSASDTRRAGPYAADSESQGRNGRRKERAFRCRRPE